jgi:hypothetical protein
MASQWSAVARGLATRARPALSLKHFTMQVEGRKLYRSVLRAIKGLDPGTAAGVREAARQQFDDHREETDVERLRIWLVDGQYSLDQMRSALGGVSPTVRRTPEARGR